ncbi:MAG: MCE family protein [Verrucomicrobia bacterium]|nr:MCE family protein [Verrucomicrobiota bacterium]
MSAKANYFKLGMFIIVAVVIGVVGVLVLGAGKLFEKRIILETYLNESVQGVDIGSKVKFRGVPVGNIRRIDFTRNRYEQEKPPLQRRSYVRIEIEMSADALGAKTETIVNEDLPREIQNGLRVRLTALGVTGTSYLEVDYLDPQKNPPLPIDWKPDYPYIPSAPGALGRIVSSAEDVFAQLEKINFERIANNIELLVVSLDNKVSELPLGMLGTNATGLLNEVRVSNARLQKLLERPEIDSMLKDGSGALAGLRRTAESPELTNSLVQIQRTLRRLDQLVAGKENDLGVSLDNLRALTENLRELSENAKRFPAQLFFGEPPKPSKTLP